MGEWQWMIAGWTQSRQLETNIKACKLVFTEIEWIRISGITLEQVGR